MEGREGGGKDVVEGGGRKKGEINIPNVDALKEVGCEVALMHDGFLELQFLFTLLQYVLFDGMFGDEAIDLHFARLTDAMTTILGLLIHR